MEILLKYYNFQYVDNYLEKRTTLMASYAHDILELTSCHPGEKAEDFVLDYEEIETETYVDSLHSRFNEVDNDIIHQNKLCHCCQIHKCNAFCMRHKKTTHMVSIK